MSFGTLMPPGNSKLATAADGTTAAAAAAAAAAMLFAYECARVAALYSVYS